MEGYGSTLLWGFAPSMDLLHEYNQGVSDILSVSAGDLRNILHTLYKHSDEGLQLHFFIQETKYETIARHLLLLMILVDNELSVENRSSYFLQIYGNTLLTADANAYMKKKAYQAIRLIGYNEYGNLEGILNFNCMKHKDKDAIEEICVK